MLCRAGSAMRVQGACFIPPRCVFALVATLCYHSHGEHEDEGADMTEELFGELLEAWGLGDILLSDEKAFGEMIAGVSSLSPDDHAACRSAAAAAMGDSHDIEQYPLLRKALKIEPDADVRKAIKVAADKLEEEFGEDECLARNEAFTGGVKAPVDSFAAMANGDFYGGNLGDFR